MATDAERRDVARRLRELVPCLFDDGEYIDCGEVEEALGLVNDDGAWYKADGVMRLADLIEPSEHKTKCIAEVKINEDKIHEFVDEEAAYLREAVHQASVELIGIDRDALLALADEMNSDADFWGGFTVCMLYTRDVREYARRIREACGVDNG